MALVRSRANSRSRGILPASPALFVGPRPTRFLLLSRLRLSLCTSTLTSYGQCYCRRTLCPLDWLILLRACSSTPCSSPLPFPNFVRLLAPGSRDRSRPASSRSRKWRIHDRLRLPPYPLFLPLPPTQKLGFFLLLSQSLICCASKLSFLFAAPFLLGLDLQQGLRRRLR